MAYGTAAGVSALLPAMGTLTASSKPINTAHVTAWLAEGASVIDRVLSGAGYTVPVTSGATVYAELGGLNNLYAAAMAARARGLDTVTGSNEDRSATWLKEFFERLVSLTSTPLTDVPVTTTATTTRGRFRMTQLKRVDGYSAPYDDDTDMDS